ncbi:MAG: hypothetical protein HY318_16535 [Armatimonadetes bacterium]|nr:hypothetical protein [Armatimonadota bacterium]
MSVSREMAIREGMNTQTAIVEVGMVEDLTVAEVTAHQGMIDGLNTDLTQEGTAQGTATGTRVANRTKWQALYTLCEAVQEIAVSKAPNEAGRAAMERVDSAGGFNVTRARRLARQVQGALEQYPETFRGQIEGRNPRGVGRRAGLGQDCVGRAWRAAERSGRDSENGHRPRHRERPDSHDPGEQLRRRLTGARGHRPRPRPPPRHNQESHRAAGRESVAVCGRVGDAALIVEEGAKSCYAIVLVK